MAIGFDASSESHSGTTGSASQTSFNWQHTPAGTPKGVLVFVFVTGSTSDIVGTVSYGASAMTAVPGGRAVDTAAETGSCKAYFLGSSVPTGQQTVTVNRSNTTNQVYAVCITVTAANAVTEATGVVLLQEDGAYTEQNVNDGSVGVNSMRFAGAYYGGANPPVAGSNSTALQSIDFGNFTAGVVRETNAGQGSRPVGFTDASDDRAAVHLAIREQVHSVTPNALATAAPTLGAPTLTQGHALGPNALATGAPTLGAPTVTQNHALVPTDIATGAPTLGTPTVTVQVNYALAPVGIDAGAPTIGTPSLGQTHALAPTAISTGAPTLGSATLAQDHALGPTAVATGAPSLGTPVLTQDHALAPVGAAAGAPTLGSPAIAQDHALVPVGISTGAPTLDAPTLAQSGTLLLDNLSAGAPTLGSPSLTQDQNLVAADLAAGPPTLGAMAITVNVHVQPVDLVAGAPQMGSATLTQDHALTLVDLIAGAPVLDPMGAVQGSQTNIALVPLSIVAGSPTLGRPAMHETIPQRASVTRQGHDGTATRSAPPATTHRRQTGGGVVSRVRSIFTVRRP